MIHVVCLNIVSLLHKHARSYILGGFEVRHFHANVQIYTECYFHMYL